MIIAASAIAEYLHPEMQTKVCHPDGSLWKVLSGHAVQILCDRRMVTGRGSRRFLKCVILNNDTAPAVAEDIVEKQLRADSVRGRLASSQASQTCVAERWSNHIGTVTVYRHVRGSVFANASQRLQTTHARITAATAEA